MTSLPKKRNLESIRQRKRQKANLFPRLPTPDSRLPTPDSRLPTPYSH
ncbi:hypothetical protein [Moorena bouillonii]|nr:hypothetical protein [Moorena bouillonii]